MSELEPTLDRFLRQRPTLGQGVYIAEGAVVVGDVTLGDHSSVWYNAVLRGDINRIVVGHHTNIQDNAVLHLEEDLPCLVGNYVTVGHLAIVHACTVGDETLIGMGATILDGAKIGNRCLIGAKALVTKNTQIPDGSLVLGAPAEIVRSLRPEELSALKASAERYAQNAAYCRKHEINVSSPKSRYLFWE
jgi:carbonic anhydrase/acetyltransferase-like protein (isoleucine patch superfamily)